MEHVITESPRTHIKSEVIGAGPRTKLIRLDLPAGEALPSHAAPGHVAIAIISGEGEVEVAGRTINAEPGAVIEVLPGDMHGVSAEQDLSIRVSQTK